MDFWETAYNCVIGWILQLAIAAGCFLASIVAAYLLATIYRSVSEQILLSIIGAIYIVLIGSIIREPLTRR